MGFFGFSLPTWEELYKNNTVNAVNVSNTFNAINAVDGLNALNACDFNETEKKFAPESPKVEHEQVVAPPLCAICNQPAEKRFGLVKDGVVVYACKSCALKEQAAKKAGVSWCSSTASFCKSLQQQRKKSMPLSMRMSS